MINNILITNYFLAFILVMTALIFSKKTRTYLTGRKISTVLYCVHPLWLSRISIIRKMLEISFSVYSYTVMSAARVFLIGGVLAFAQKKCHIVDFLI